MSSMEMRHVETREPKSSTAIVCNAFDDSLNPEGCCTAQMWFCPLYGCFGDDELNSPKLLRFK